jgi:hypothetical protein
MFVLRSRRARRISSFGASIAIVVAGLVVASPAQAVVGVDLSVDDTTITVGDSVTLSWTSTDAVDLVAGESWSGNKTVPDGSEVITPGVAGTFTYKLLATDVDGREATDEVTVTVAAPAPITPNPVTFPDACTIAIPSTPHVKYFLDGADGASNELSAGTYPGYQTGPETPVTIRAVADEGYTLAKGAVDEWDYTASRSCFVIGPKLVTATATCGTITFTNTTDGPLDVLYVSVEDLQPEGQFTLAAGAKHKVKTSTPDVGYAVFEDVDGGEGPIQIRLLKVPQDCDDDDANGNGSSHPTVAPAAGIAPR